MEFNYRISTMTVSGSYNCLFNLTNIGKYLEIDNEVIGIKYDYGETSILKGKYTTSIYKKSKNKNINKINKTLFYNQVSLIIQNNNNIVNAKLFANGSLHLTGVKKTSEINNIMDIIYKKLIQLKCKTDVVLLFTDNNNVYLDNNNIIYSNYTDNYKDKTIVGYKNKENMYIINKKSYIIDDFTGMFISHKIETKRTKTILNLNGEIIGNTKIELLKNKVKLYKKNSNINFDIKNIIFDKDMPYYLIYYDNDNYSSVIGKVVYNLNSLSKNTSNVNLLEYKYSCNPFITPEQETQDKMKWTVDINCINIYFNINIEINRQRLFNKLIEYNFTCEYKPEKYSGVKYIYKYSTSNQNNQNGICKCSDKCTCNNITFLIFQSGNIIVTGFKNENHIDNVINTFKKFMCEIESNIKKKNAFE